MLCLCDLHVEDNGNALEFSCLLVQVVKVIYFVWFCFRNSYCLEL